MINNNSKYQKNQMLNQSKLLYINLTRQIHTTLSKFTHPVKPFPKCLKENFEEKKQKLRTSETIRRLKQDSERSCCKININLINSCRHPTKIPPCTSRARLDCNPDPTWIKSKCKKWEAPRPAFSECSPIRTFLSIQCLACKTTLPKCFKRKKLGHVKSQCVKLPPGLQVQCSIREKPKPIPWIGLSRCVQEIPYRSDDDNPKVWKKLVPVFPIVRPRPRPRGW